MANKYGYPICCDSWFTARIQRKVVFELTYLQQKYSKHGFVPCPSCAEKLEKENMRLDQLIIKENRIVNTDFPMCLPRSDKELQKIMESLSYKNNCSSKKEH